jgi:nicotinamidase-related amidase
MKREALLVVDAQVQMFDPADPVADAPLLLERLRRLVAAARAAGVPVVWVRNRGRPGHADEPGAPGFEIHAALAPAATEAVVDKRSRDAFQDTELGAVLGGLGIEALTVAGMQSEFCITATCRGALERGYEVALVADAHGTCDTAERPASAIRHDVNEALFAEVDEPSTDEVCAEWAQRRTPA